MWLQKCITAQACSIVCVVIVEMMVMRDKFELLNQPYNGPHFNVTRVKPVDMDYFSLIEEVTLTGGL